MTSTGTEQDADPGSDEELDQRPADGSDEQNGGQDDEAVSAAARKGRLTPKQARRLRMAIAAVAMAAMAVVLVIRLGDGSSLLSVGLYGVAFVLSGAVIEMSRRGRTRLGTAVLVAGFVLILGTDWWLRSTL
ncbi:hypothetical protein [Streptomyces aidingensis]|uniref:Uncharacterized protein n=1 Tax=Streptomyces aidingensis TaxID=910347 RepID=A0A1I1P7J7_9ACTN|nr:hypothetical protein [Streptomyces aidingensis]SFD02963.1 hypothetical protein SAMN05421773_108249 [Streptomyces aidingensis]